MARNTRRLALCAGAWVWRRSRWAWALGDRARLRLTASRLASLCLRRLAGSGVTRSMAMVFSAALAMMLYFLSRNNDQIQGGQDSGRVTHADRPLTSEPPPDRRAVHARFPCHTRDRGLTPGDLSEYCICDDVCVHRSAMGTVEA